MITYRLFRVKAFRVYNKGMKDGFNMSKALIAFYSRADEIPMCLLNYWSTMPKAVFTFLEHFDFTGITIKPFCTHEGSGQILFV